MQESTINPFSGGGMRLFVRTARRHWLAATLLTLALSLAAIAGILMLPQKWTASAYIVLEDGGQRVVDIEGVLPDRPVDIEALASEIEIIRSRAVAGMAIERIGIDRLLEPAEPASPAMTSAGAGEEVLAWLRRMRAEAGRLLGQAVAFLRGGEARQPQPPPREEALAALRNGMDVNPLGRSRVIEIVYTADDPKLARDAADSIAEAYLERRQQRKAQASAAAKNWIEREIERVREDVRSAEYALEQYRADSGLLRGREAELLPQETLSELQGALAEARAAESAARTRLERLRQLLEGGSLEGPLPQFIESPTIQALREREAQIRIELSNVLQRYQAGTPAVERVRGEMAQVRQEIRQELRSAVAAVEADAEYASARVASLQAMIQDTGRDLMSASEKSVGLEALEREVEAGRELLQTLLAREQELAAQLSLETPNAYLLSNVATPTDPSFPQVVPMSVLAVLGAGFLSVGFVVLRDLSDRTVRSADEVSALTPYEPLGLVPRFARMRKGPALTVAALDRDRFAEAMKGVYVRLSQAGDPPAGRLLVTSALPGEGKTTTATALGMVGASLGRRVALLEVDARHPNLHRIFRLPLGPGLLEYLRGDAIFEEVVRPVRNNLSIITAGCGDNLSDLLKTDRLDGLIQDLSASYDQVIIDTPPILAVTEALALAPVADRIVHVVRWGDTRRTTLMAALGRYGHLDPKRIGIVLSQVDIRRHSSYGYLDSELYQESLNRYYLG